MDEGVFLVFVPFALLAIAVAILFIRGFESALGIDRWRLSTFVWTTSITLIVMGFINMSDSWLLLGAWITISVLFVFQVVERADEIQRGRHLLWALLLITPGGWVLYFTRFPHFHGIDADSERSSTATS